MRRAVHTTKLAMLARDALLRELFQHGDESPPLFHAGVSEQ